MTWTIDSGPAGMQRLYWTDNEPIIRVSLRYEGVAIEVDPERGNRVVGIMVARTGTSTREMYWLLDRVPRWMLGTNTDILSGVVHLDNPDTSPEQFRHDPQELDEPVRDLRERIVELNTDVDDEGEEYRDEGMAVVWSDLPPGWRPRSIRFWSALKVSDNDGAFSVNAGEHVTYDAGDAPGSPLRVLLARAFSESGELTRLGRLSPEISPGGSGVLWSGTAEPFGERQAETTHWQVVDRMVRPTRTLDEQTQLVNLQQRLIDWVTDSRSDDEPITGERVVEE